MYPYISQVYDEASILFYSLMPESCFWLIVHLFVESLAPWISYLVYFSIFKHGHFIGTKKHVSPLQFNKPDMVVLLVLDSNIKYHK